MTEKERKEAILDALEKTWPEAKAELHFTNPYETLVATILSAQCLRVAASDGHMAAVSVRFAEKVTKEQILERWPGRS